MKKKLTKIVNKSYNKITEINLKIKSSKDISNEEVFKFNDSGWEPPTWDIGNGGWDIT